MKRLMTEIGVAAILILAIGFLLNILKEKDEELRVVNETRASLLKQDTAKVVNGKSTINSAQLTLNEEEFRSRYSEIAAQLKDLNIKYKRVNDIVLTGGIVKIIFKDRWRDSIVNGDTIRCITFKDNWTTITGCDSAGVFKGNFESRDSLIVTTHRIPKKFLFIKYGTKKIETTVYNTNPHVKIKWSEKIKAGN